jgi:ATP-dependent helicase/nuclease subunit B
MTGPAALNLRPSLATLAPGTAFLDTLAAWWLARTQAASDDPLAVAHGVFLVPTRRAARGLSQAFLEQAGGRPLLMPRILPLGGLDEASPLFAGVLDLPPPVPAPQRLAVLSRMVLAMGGKNGAPTEADRAWVLAEELANLLDEAARAEIDLGRALPGAAGADFAAHWTLTLEFLKIVTASWPAWLVEQGFSDVAAHQIAALDAQTAAWRADPPALPVIAAGTTGAIPAVGRLLRLVAHLPQGMVVLPGLDLGLDEASWDALDHSHPQASLRALLASLQARRADVEDFTQSQSITVPRTYPPDREAAWRTALLPAASLGAWQDAAELDTGGLQRIEPADQQEEAQCIALMLREALEVPGARAALVTPDRQLARRVAAELLRFGVVADDSAGEPLAETPAAVFLRLLAEAVAENLRPVPLLALLKHPLCAAGLSTAACREAARRLERDCLRGARPGPGIEGLRGRNGAAGFLDRLAGHLRPLLALMEAPDATPDHAFVALIETAEALAGTDEEAGAKRLWAGEDGEALALHLGALHEALPVLPPQRLVSLPGLLDATLAGVAVRSRRSLRGRGSPDATVPNSVVTEHPRVFIWGLLEARLQTADVLVLGGLTEGVWPPIAESGPWMNRAMRQTVGLPSPEERIGLAAHDFVMASCSAPHVVLSAPRRRDGAPAVPSRWLVRLQALLKGRHQVLPCHAAPSWSRALDRPAGAPTPARPPAPSPAVALRPRRLSVTEIETWLRDPYAIYARHVLRLRRLDPLEESADAADYGVIVHDGLNRFFSRMGLAWPADAAAQLVADMDAALDAACMRPALAAWWRPRLRRIAGWVAGAEADRRAANPPTFIGSELTGVWVFDAPAGPFTLRGRADRIERRADGSMAILDYKTGRPPSSRDVEDGRSPQLPLEAAMAQQGAFGAGLMGEVSELVFWHIPGGYEPGSVVALFKKDQAAKTAEVVAFAQASLRALVAAFDDPARAYLSQPSPGAAPRFTDYAQLARVAEWAAADDGAERPLP